MRSDRPQWAGRVPPHRIKRLYAWDAKGIVDEAMIDEVGYTLLARCESILTVTEAHNKRRVACPLCGQFILHNWNDEDLLRCGDCDWQLSWGAYRKTYQKKQLHAGGMEPFLKAFAVDFSQARDPQDKMILIDTLPHRYHGEFEGSEGRPGALNLIAVKGTKEVRAFLDGLGGKELEPKYPDAAEAWVERVKREEEPGWQME